MSAEATADRLDDEPTEGAGAKPARKFTGKKLVLFIVLPILLLAGIGAGVMFSGILDSEKPNSAPEQSPAQPGLPSDAASASKTVFYDLPEMLVNLNTAGRRPSYLKILVSLELSTPEEVLVLRQHLPRIVDTFQIFLRELRLDDLRGSAGMYRLREELLARVNATTRPVVVKDVLFKQMLVQ